MKILKFSNFKQNYNQFANIMRIDEPLIVNFIQDFEIDIRREYEKFPIDLTNCLGIYIKPETITFEGMSYNYKTYVQILKTFFDGSENKVLKSLPIIHILPNRIPNGKFIIYDHSMIIEMIKNNYDRLNKKLLTMYLLKKLSTEYREVKQSVSQIEQTTIFSINKVHTGIYNLILNFENIHKFLKLNSLLKSEDVKFYDNFVFVGGFLSRQFITPIIVSIKDNHKFLKSNLKRFETFLGTIKEEVSQNEDDFLKKEKFKALTVKNIKGFQKKLINQEHLSKFIETYKITDPVLIANINFALDDYKQDLPESDKNVLILKVIKFTLTGSTVLKKEELIDPEPLFKALKNRDVYKHFINLPNSNDKEPVMKTDIIDLKYVTGPSLHAYEYDENIDKAVKKLLSLLEMKKPTFEVLGINKEIVDDGYNRYALFKVKVQNPKGLGLQEPYEINFKIPYLVNGKYFKLNSVEYIMSSQQFLNPITKDKPKTVRLLTQFNTVTTSITNQQHNVAELGEIINSLSIKYPKAFSKIDRNSSDGEITFVQFADDYDTKYYNSSESDTILEGSNFKIFKNNGNYFIEYNNDIKSQKILPNYNEELYGRIVQIVENITGIKETFSTKKKSQPYISILIANLNIPILFLFWYKYGLIDALMNLDIKFEISDYVDDKAYENIFCMDGKYLNIYANKKKDELLLNSFIYLTTNQKKFASINELYLPESIYPYLNNKNTRFQKQLDNMINNIIDPTTHDILKFYNYPTDFFDLQRDTIIPMLLNAPMSHPSDLKLYRSRQSEVLTGILYNELIIAYNTFLTRSEYDTKQEMKLYVDPNYIIDYIMGRHDHSKNDGGVLLDYVAPFSPVDEIMKSSKAVRTGKGGIPNKRAVRKEQRSIHPSYVGNIAAHSTSEYADVGILQFHTLGVNITNTFGDYGGKVGAYSKYNYDSLSIDEALTPFVNQMDSARLIIARTHTG